MLPLSLFWMLGFITMTPQLFINYKMKSVAHLPWRMLTYKALNTFIDDLFAFVIKMPMMYRIGCLRDGLYSLIYMYFTRLKKVEQMYEFIQFNILYSRYMLPTSHKM